MRYICFADSVDVSFVFCRDKRSEGATGLVQPRVEFFPRSDHVLYIYARIAELRLGFSFRDPQLWMSNVAFSFAPD